MRRPGCQEFDEEGQWEDHRVGEASRGWPVLRTFPSLLAGTDEFVHVHLLQEAHTLPSCGRLIFGLVSPAPSLLPAPSGNGLLWEISENCNMLSLCPRGTGEVDSIWTP